MMRRGLLVSVGRDGGKHSQDYGGYSDTHSLLHLPAALAGNLDRRLPLFGSTNVAIECHLVGIFFDLVCHGEVLMEELLVQHRVWVVLRCKGTPSVAFNNALRLLKSLCDVSDRTKPQQPIST
jgi:hypothetical protein